MPPARFGILALAAFTVASALAPASPELAKPAPELTGLWGATRSFGPEIRGELTIRRAGNGSHAEIGGTWAPVEMGGGEVRFALAGNKGSFRGRLEEGAIRGLWIQPAGVVTGVAWATPVELRPMGAGVWRGAVVPLDESFTLYADIRAEADGKVFAVLRNPDGSYRNGRLALAAEGSHFKLNSINNGATLLEGDYDSKAGRILLPIPDLATLELTRQSRDQAGGYYPRTPAEPRYAYRPPLAEKDGWRTSSLAASGFDEAKVSELVQKILDTDPRPQTAPLIQGLLIARHGKLVLEEYFYGFDKESRHDLRSLGKTWASALAGIAIDRGAKFGPQTPVYSLFPEYATTANPDPRKAKMTVEHLMTMTSGFACDENGDENAPGNEDKMQGQTEQPDWYKFILDLPLSAAPGDKAAYCTGAVNLIGGIVRNTTRAWLPDFFDRYLARPLEFHRYHLNLTPTGEAYMGGGTHIRSRDALKLGQLYLNGGVWNGKRVVSKRWVDVSVVPHPMNARGTDGYNWHTNEIKAGDKVYRQYEANGNGGQLLMVIPDLDLVVLFTAGNYGNYRVWRTFREDLLPQYILSAIKDPTR